MNRNLFKSSFILIVLLTIFSSITQCNAKKQDDFWEEDTSSFSNTRDLRVSHMKLNLKTDFDRKVLSGYVIHEVEVINNKAEALVLDTMQLRILSVNWLKDDEEITLDYSFGEEDEIYGKPLRIPFTSEMLKNSKVNIKIDYETTPDCSACQWVEPIQTEGKKYPYLYTQCESIYARSIVPCQDTPSNKLTYEAEMTVPKELNALMSAIKVDETPADKGLVTYKFEQKMKISTYLIAIAVGNIKGVKIGPRSTVWSEPEYVDNAVKEFDDIEKFIKIAEDYLIDYQWGVYDILVLPSSFPYGGMENPNLTFVSKTSIAGDKSLVDLLVHELAHSWTGNLVTNSNWQHFWLNEGYTIYIERKILSKIHGEKYRDFYAIVSYNELKVQYDGFSDEDQVLSQLIPDLSGRNPDDNFTNIPYEKGFALLYYLEKILGGPEVFDPFNKEYIIHFANQSVNSYQWKDFLYSYYREHDKSKVKILDTVDWDTWFYGQGLFPVDLKYDRTLFNECDDLADRWIAKKNDTSFDEFSPKDIENFDAQRLKVFLARISDEAPYSSTFIDAFDRIYKINDIKNCEDRFVWLVLCLKSSYQKIYPEVVKFVEEQGRAKFVYPLYLHLNNAENGHELAFSTFEKNMNYYHPITVSIIKNVMGYDDSKLPEQPTELPTELPTEEPEDPEDPEDPEQSEKSDEESKEIKDAELSSESDSEEPELE